ncbi:MAG: hypothetical protein ACRYF5_15515, partial [Janthinobacterium lividum]
MSKTMRGLPAGLLCSSVDCVSPGAMTGQHSQQCFPLADEGLWAQQFLVLEVRQIEQGLAAFSLARIILHLDRGDFNQRLTFDPGAAIQAHAVDFVKMPLRDLYAC